jgi:hypothetical protein
MEKGKEKVWDGWTTKNVERPQVQGRGTNRAIWTKPPDDWTKINTNVGFCLTTRKSKHWSGCSGIGWWCAPHNLEIHLTLWLTREGGS